MLVDPKWLLVVTIDASGIAYMFPEVAPPVLLMKADPCELSEL